MHVGSFDEVLSDAGSTPAASTIRLTRGFPPMPAVSLMASHSTPHAQAGAAVGRGQRECPERVNAVSESKGVRHPFYVYILRCSDASLYVGSTDDLRARLLKHSDGSASRYTALRRPVTLVHSEIFTSQRQALKREFQLKRWSRAKKEALIAADFAALKRL